MTELSQSALSRRALLALAGAAALTTALPRRLMAQGAAPLMRAIPSSGERIPAVGLGTWITFNVGNDPKLRTSSFDVMRAFFAAGGTVVDSSPMYGSSQGVVGEGLKRLGMPRHFSAEKVWISGKSRGVAQMEDTRREWGVPKFDLMQVHNLLDWEQHLPTLFAMKAEGRLRYVGITTSDGRRHDDIVHVMRTQRIDFIQVSYNVADRQVDRRILPLAQERGIAVLINRPFQEGRLTERLRRYPLPPVAKEAGVTSWAQYILKYILGHPAVTCVIPATSRVDHVRENVAAATGPIPDEALRRRMVAEFEAL